MLIKRLCDFVYPFAHSRKSSVYIISKKIPENISKEGSGKSDNNHITQIKHSLAGQKRRDKQHYISFNEKSYKHNRVAKRLPKRDIIKN